MQQVPKFLRHQGKIKNRHLKKVELEVQKHTRQNTSSMIENTDARIMQKIIRKVWKEKRRRDERSGLHLSLVSAHAGGF